MTSPDHQGTIVVRLHNIDGFTAACRHWQEVFGRLQSALPAITAPPTFIAEARPC